MVTYHFLTHDATASSNTGGLWVVLNSDSVVLVYRLLVMLVCRLSVMVVAGGALTGGLSGTSNNTPAELLSGMEARGWGLLVSAFHLVKLLEV